jgi:hypothetical protein
MPKGFAIQAHKERVTKSISNKFKHSKRKASAVPLQAAMQPVRSPATADGGGGEVRGQVQQVTTMFCRGRFGMARVEYFGDNAAPVSLACRGTSAN